MTREELESRTTRIAMEASWRETRELSMVEITAQATSLLVEILFQVHEQLGSIDESLKKMAGGK
jgi:hypothetical protein